MEREREDGNIHMLHKTNGTKESKDEGNYATLLHSFKGLNNCRRGNYSALHLLSRRKSKGKSLLKEELPNPEAA